ncbi:hypothetical protein PC9H_010208 [Pleurotus ostreatus]|uniref:SUN domain-containing protein n=1 Tax=Pleurotus ostreatus TaxID=5322 RepID=A0A8H6ZR65_PLEOS|nr:uncharacterized protein PC9H_010208 [Pleurotus ostreatus]KAF7424897.1 hypothetical protein PC9H_010208 [Pleurotus ostreatus]
MSSGDEDQEVGSDMAVDDWDSGSLVPPSRFAPLLPHPALAPFNSHALHGDLIRNPAMNDRHTFVSANEAGSDVTAIGTPLALRDNQHVHHTFPEMSPTCLLAAVSTTPVAEGMTPRDDLVLSPNLLSRDEGVPPSSYLKSSTPDASDKFVLESQHIGHARNTSNGRVTKDPTPTRVTVVVGSASRKPYSIEGNDTAMVRDEWKEETSGRSSEEDDPTPGDCLVTYQTGWDGESNEGDHDSASVNDPINQEWRSDSGSDGAVDDSRKSWGSESVEGDHNPSSVNDPINQEWRSDSGSEGEEEVKVEQEMDQDDPLSTIAAVVAEDGWNEESDEGSSEEEDRMLGDGAADDSRKSWGSESVEGDDKPPSNHDPVHREWRDDSGSEGEEEVKVEQEMDQDDPMSSTASVAAGDQWNEESDEGSSEEEDRMLGDDAADDSKKSWGSESVEGDHNPSSANDPINQEWRGDSGSEGEEEVKVEQVMDQDDPMSTIAAVVVVAEDGWNEEDRERIARQGDPVLGDGGVAEVEEGEQVGQDDPMSTIAAIIAEEDHDAVTTVEEAEQGTHEEQDPPMSSIASGSEGEEAVKVEKEMDQDDPMSSTASVAAGDRWNEEKNDEGSSEEEDRMLSDGAADDSKKSWGSESVEGDDKPPSNHDPVHGEWRDDSHGEDDKGDVGELVSPYYDHPARVNNSEIEWQAQSQAMPTIDMLMGYGQDNGLESFADDERDTVSEVGSLGFGVTKPLAIQAHSSISSSVRRRSQLYTNPQEQNDDMNNPPAPNFDRSPSRPILVEQSHARVLLWRNDVPPRIETSSVLGRDRSVGTIGNDGGGAIGHRYNNPEPTPSALNRASTPLFLNSPSECHSYQISTISTTRRNTSRIPSPWDHRSPEPSAHGPAGFQNARSPSPWDHRSPKPSAHGPAGFQNARSPSPWDHRSPEPSAHGPAGFQNARSPSPWDHRSPKPSAHGPAGFQNARSPSPWDHRSPEPSAHGPAGFQNARSPSPWDHRSPKPSAHGPAGFQNARSPSPWDHRSPEPSAHGPAGFQNARSPSPWDHRSHPEPSLAPWGTSRAQSREHTSHSDQSPFDNGFDRGFWGHHPTPGSFSEDNAHATSMHGDTESDGGNEKPYPNNGKHPKRDKSQRPYPGEEERQKHGKHHRRRRKHCVHCAPPNTDDGMSDSDEASGPPQRTYNVRHLDPKGLVLKSEIRIHCDRTLMERSLKIATEDMIRSFTLKPYGPIRPTVANFAMDARPQKGITTAWNKRLIEVFVQDFMEQPQYTCKDPAKIEHHFKQHLYQLKQRAAKLPTPEAAKAKSRENRRRALRERRVKACRNYSRQDPTLHRFLDLLGRLPYYAMSGDETDADASTSIGIGKTIDGYSITNLPWRSSDPEVTHWFRTFDLLHLSTRYMMTGNPTPGEWPRVRLPSSRIEKHKAEPPLGLPENFYGSAFLQSLHPMERQRLKVQTSMDLSFSREIETFRFASNAEYAISPPALRRGAWLKRPVVAFTLGILTALLGKQSVVHASTIIDAYLTPHISSGQMPIDATFAVLTSITDRLLANATPASVPPRNLALFGGGARVNSLLTSATYNPHAHGSVGPLRRGLRWVRDTMLGVEFSRLHMSRPRDALSENMELGRCWEFEGPTGHIAIELPEVVTITDASVAYIPAPLLSQVAVGRAPRRVTMWGLADNTTAQHFTESHAPSLFTANHRNPPGMHYTDRFVKLGGFVFDIDSSHHQFFAMDPDSATIQTSLVIFEVNNNHGSSTTCLYYLGVYGIEVS